MFRAIATTLAVIAAGVWLAGPAGAIPDQGTPEFDNYMQGLERNGFHLNPDTAWRLAHQSCEGSLPGFLGWELAAQGVVGPGAGDRVAAVARQYNCPVK